jgi:hypothetical protein
VRITVKGHHARQRNPVPPADGDQSPRTFITDMAALDGLGEARKMPSAESDWLTLGLPSCLKARISTSSAERVAGRSPQHRAGGGEGGEE